jgi:hypothetical protein
MSSKRKVDVGSRQIRADLLWGHGCVGMQVGHGGMVVSADLPWGHMAKGTIAMPACLFDSFAPNPCHQRGHGKCLQAKLLCQHKVEIVVNIPQDCQVVRTRSYSAM